MSEADHDQRFKALIREFFADFMRLFFAEWTANLDFSRVEWLDQEAFPDPPDGPRRVLDLVAKLPLRKGDSTEDWLALVHVEIVSADSAASLRRRMYRYHGFLRDRHDLPVLPIAVFLKVGLDGIGIDVYEERFEEFETLRFRYLYVGLPGLDGVKYMEGDNPLGVALSALMRVPRERIAWLGAEAQRRLTEASVTEKQRFLLAECVQAYLPMDDEQRAEFNRLIEAKQYGGVKAMNKTVFEEGLDQGREKGREEGREDALRTMIRDQLEAKFGPLPDVALTRLNAVSLTLLPELGRGLVRAGSLGDLGLEDD